MSLLTGHCMAVPGWCASGDLGIEEHPPNNSVTKIGSLQQIYTGIDI